MDDLIKRADAIEAVIAQRHKEELSEYNFALGLAEDAIRNLPSAEAVPTVIRSRTLIPAKDFKEWAKRIREINPNAVIIPCDAEVVSADAVQVVRCKDCRYANECHKNVQYTRNELNTVTIGYSPIEWCSRGERREE